MRAVLAVVTALCLGACTLVTNLERFRIEDAGGDDSMDASADTRVPGLDAAGRAGVDAAREAGAAGGGYLDRCASDEDCAEGLACIPDLGGTSFCSRTCSASAECAAEHVCDFVDVVQLCTPDDTGRPCTNDDECRTGRCVQFGTHRVCTRRCSDSPGDRPCPVGFSCDMVGAEPARLCAREECAGSCDCGPERGCPWRQACVVTACEGTGAQDLTAACAFPADCRSGLCSYGRCTRVCADGLCPTTWTCSLTLCLPPGP